MDRPRHPVLLAVPPRQGTIALTGKVATSAALQQSPDTVTHSADTIAGRLCNIDDTPNRSAVPASKS